ncbi:MAG: sulfite reductase [Peptococcaceae bacterium]|nr:MAG: sulfite reductase [Peptococcaceae bacterium]
MEDIKKAILEFASDSKKSKFYFKDMEKAVQKTLPDAKSREIKKAATALVNEGTLIYFSTGSSTMYGLKGRGITEDPE